MNNTEMREFLEKELPGIKNLYYAFGGGAVFSKAEMEGMILALDKAVEDVRKLRENTKWTAQALHGKHHTHSQTIVYSIWVCKIGVCSAAAKFLKETEWAEVKIEK